MVGFLINDGSSNKWWEFYLMMEVLKNNGSSKKWWEFY